MRKRFRLLDIVRYAVLLIASAVSLFPVLWLATVSLKSSQEYVNDPIGLPDGIDLSNFGTVLGNDHMIRYFTNSVIVVGIAVPIVTVTAVAAGYALARLWGRSGMVLLFVFLFSELVPIGIIVIPLLITVREIGIEHGIMRLILVYSVALMGFAVLVSRAFFRSIPEQLREAARLDGCSELQVLRRIMLPLGRSPIALIAVIAFIALWNEYFLAVVLVNDSNQFTLPLGLTDYRGQYSTNWPTVAAALLVSTAPTMVLYALFQGRIASQFTRSTTRA
jgi:raffinose/stachyose/melibiose transport system permease protein